MLSFATGGKTMDRDTIATIAESLNYMHINCAKCSQAVKIT
jgi:hypothetical protein